MQGKPFNTWPRLSEVMADRRAQEIYEAEQREQARRGRTPPPQQQQQHIPSRLKAALFQEEFYRTYGRWPTVQEQRAAGIDI
jgi:hypothetical protein